MLVLLGRSGYMGQAFEKALKERGWAYIPLSRSQVDYTQFDALYKFLKKTKATQVLNAAGFTGLNIDACEKDWSTTLLANAMFPAQAAHACSALGIPFGHVSTGCIYNGAKIALDGQERLELNLNRPEIRQLLEQNPAAIRGFTEEDEPNFSFRHPPCSFYSGAKVLAEEAIKSVGKTYIWRLRIPFDQFDQPKNLLTKLQAYPKVQDTVNSISHRGDFVNACLELWEKKAPFGIYNVTNPGWLTNRRIIELIQKTLKPPRAFEFWPVDEDFSKMGVRAPRSTNILDVSKLLAAGVKMRPVEEAVVDALEKWTPRTTAS